MSLIPYKRRTVDEFKEELTDRIKTAQMQSNPYFDPNAQFGPNLLTLIDAMAQQLFAQQELFHEIIEVTNGQDQGPARQE